MRGGFIFFLLFCISLGDVLSASEIVGRAEVIDGDTLDIGTTRIRLFGIDAPEQNQQCLSSQSMEWACGAWVTQQVHQIVEGKTLRCDPRETDRYGRVVPTSTMDGRDLARELVIDGLAYAYRRYSMEYDLDEKAAAVRGTGLHAHRVQSPADYRQALARGVATRTNRCRIKGNISRDGARIYHMPGQRDYARTRINERNGEKWFCSAAQAEEGGWRPARH